MPGIAAGTGQSSLAAVSLLRWGLSCKKPPLACLSSQPAACLTYHQILQTEELEIFTVAEKLSEQLLQGWNEAPAKAAVQMKTVSISLLYSSSFPQQSSTTHLRDNQFMFLALFKLRDSSVRTPPQQT